MSRFAIRTSLASLALVLGAGMVAAPVIAAPEQGDTSTHMKDDRGPGKHDRRGHHERGHRDHGRMMMRDAVMIPGLGPIFKSQVEALKLTADQQAKVDAARAAQRDLFKGRHEAGKPLHELLDKQLADGKLDPRALVAQEDSSRKAFGDEADNVRDKWLAVWDSLDDAQREKVAGFVKERQEKMKARHARMEERMKQRMARDGGKGDAPPPPPAAGEAPPPENGA